MDVSNCTKLEAPCKENCDNFPWMTTDITSSLELPTSMGMSG